jgi:hypothetical protein
MAIFVFSAPVVTRYPRINHGCLRLQACSATDLVGSRSGWKKAIKTEHTGDYGVDHEEDGRPFQ